MTGRVVVVTGTSTDVGKTIATAALAVLAAESGRSVVVVKPVQTGVGEDAGGDAEVIHDLVGPTVHVQEFAALEAALAPATAARLAGVHVPPVAEHAERIRMLAQFYDVVLVEGAGGLLVRLDTRGGTLLDLTAQLAAELTVEVVLVCGAELGTLNHTELTVRALRGRGVPPAGLVVGSWPLSPGLAERCNLEDLPAVTGVPLLAIIPAGSGALAQDAFVKSAPDWFAAALDR